MGADRDLWLRKLTASILLRAFETLTHGNIFLNWQTPRYVVSCISQGIELTVPDTGTKPSFFCRLNRVVLRLIRNLRLTELCRQVENEARKQVNGLRYARLTNIMSC